MIESDYMCFRFFSILSLFKSSRTRLGTRVSEAMHVRNKLREDTEEEEEGISLISSL